MILFKFRDHVFRSAKIETIRFEFSDIPKITSFSTLLFYRRDKKGTKKRQKRFLSTDIKRLTRKPVVNDDAREADQKDNVDDETWNQSFFHVSICCFESKLCSKILKTNRNLEKE